MVKHKNQLSDNLKGRWHNRWFKTNKRDYKNEQSEVPAEKTGVLSTASLSCSICICWFNISQLLQSSCCPDVTKTNSFFHLLYLSSWKICNICLLYMLYFHDHLLNIFWYRNQMELWIGITRKMRNEKYKKKFILQFFIKIIHNLKHLEKYVSFF